MREYWGQRDLHTNNSRWWRSGRSTEAGIVVGRREETEAPTESVHHPNRWPPSQDTTVQNKQFLLLEGDDKIEKHRFFWAEHF